MVVQYLLMKPMARTAPFEVAMIQESISKSMRLAEWLGASVAGIRLDGGLRTRSAAVCFGVAQEHHGAIVTLSALRRPLYASVFALGRPLFEAYLRGMWLAHCATDEQVLRYHEGKLPDTKSLTLALEKLQGDGAPSNIRRLYECSWQAMSGMTHGGAEHYGKWSQGEVLEPAYSDEDVGRILDFAARIAVLSTAGLAALSDDVEHWRTVLKESTALMPRRFDAPKPDQEAVPGGATRDEGGG